MVQAQPDAGTLVPVLEDWTAPANRLSKVYMPNRHLSARMRVFVDRLVELFGKHPHVLP